MTTSPTADAPKAAVTLPPDAASSAPVEASIIPHETPAPAEDGDPGAETASPATTEADEHLNLFLESADIAAITALIERRLTLLGQAEFAARAVQEGSYENRLSRLLSDHSTEADRSLQAIAAIADKTQFVDRMAVEGRPTLGRTLTPKGQFQKGKILSGQEAILELAIKTGHMKRVPLYNSGFFLDITKPSLVDLNLFFNKAHDQTNAYGRQFGALFFYFNDLMIKEALVDLVLAMTRGSNLRGWNRQNTLIRHLKLVDLKIILLNLAAMMFPDGFDFTHICTNPSGECTHTELKKIDLTKLLMHNFAMMSPAAIAHMTNTGEIVPDQLQTYQKELEVDGKTYTFGKLEFELQSPTIADYLAYGKIFNNELLGTNFADNEADITRSLMFSYYRIYTPFIASLKIRDEKTGAVDFETRDPAAIAHQLGHLQTDDTERKLLEAFDGFIRQSEVSHVCYAGFPCPSCGYVPESGYYTVDPAHAFFIVSLTRLNQT